jgi:hypothetical protein
VQEAIKTIATAMATISHKMFLFPAKLPITRL